MNSDLRGPNTRTVISVAQYTSSDLMHMHINHPQVIRFFVSLGTWIDDAWDMKEHLMLYLRIHINKYLPLFPLTYSLYKCNCGA